MPWELFENLNCSWVCRAAVIDEMELASQMDSNIFNTGPGKETKFLPPFLHTLKATETPHLARIQWDSKLRDTMELPAKIEETVVNGFGILNVVRVATGFSAPHKLLHLRSCSAWILK